MSKQKDKHDPDDVAVIEKAEPVTVDTRHEANVAFTRTLQAKWAAESAASEASRVFEGLIPAASTALDARLHSLAEIERGYDLAMAAHEALVAAETTWGAARDAFHEAALKVLDTHWEALTQERAAFEDKQPE